VCISESESTSVLFVIPQILLLLGPFGSHMQRTRDITCGNPPLTNPVPLSHIGSRHVKWSAKLRFHDRFASSTVSSWSLNLKLRVAREQPISALLIEQESNATSF
jgi:hypothetical protein